MHVVHWSFPLSSKALLEFLRPLCICHCDAWWHNENDIETRHKVYSWITCISLDPINSFHLNPPIYDCVKQPSWVSDPSTRRVHTWCLWSCTKRTWQNNAMLRGWWIWSSNPRLLDFPQSITPALASTLPLHLLYLRELAARFSSW